MALVLQRIVQTVDDHVGRRPAPGRNRRVRPPSGNRRQYCSRHPIILGIPPWASEAGRQEYRPKVIAPGELVAALPPEILAGLTEDERAALCA